MPHEPALITTIAAAFGLALICGFLAVRLRLPALVGYMIAGVILGPATPGFVADLDLNDDRLTENTRQVDIVARRPELGPGRRAPAKLELRIRRARSSGARRR